MVKIKATNEAAGDEPIRADSHEKFGALIEVYKKQNPAKYETKKAELQRKLDALK